MIERITVDAELNPGPETPQLIFLGDYIDRGPNSKRVIDRLMGPIPGFRVHFLMGNHEAMLIDCLDSSDPEAWAVWLMNGGSDTVASFGEGFAPDLMTEAGLRDALGHARIEWLRALKLFHVAGNYVFVHAGISPGVSLENQKKRNLLWIRERFLSSKTDHGRIIVHGHTPVPCAEIHSNRINLDSGAVYGGPLTAIALADGQDPRLLTVDID